MPVFNNVANLGLLVFLFLVALEVDMRLFTQNWKAALSVGFAGMVLPFGLGFAIAYGIYHQFHTGVVENPISFGVFGLFIGTALSITAFPVLCRILSELNLLQRRRHGSGCRHRQRRDGLDPSCPLCRPGQQRQRPGCPLGLALLHRLDPAAGVCRPTAFHLGPEADRQSAEWPYPGHGRPDHAHGACVRMVYR
jgi:hypothetical protein